MSYALYGIQPQDWIRKTYDLIAVDANKVLTMRYVGSQVAAHVSVASTTGDLTFEQGATTAAAVVGTGINPMSPGGSTGIINISDHSTVGEINSLINVARDWECWMTDYRPDNDIEVTAGNIITLSAYGTDNDATGANGFTLYADTSLETAEIFPVGVTLNGPSTGSHAVDFNVVHEIIQIIADVTFGGASSGLKIYACDDRKNTSALITTLPLVSGAATTFDAGGEPIIGTRGKRIVVEATDASGAITAPDIQIAARSFAYGPAYRGKKLYSRQ